MEKRITEVLLSGSQWKTFAEIFNGVKDSAREDAEVSRLEVFRAVTRLVRADVVVKRNMRDDTRYRYVEKMAIVRD